MTLDGQDQTPDDLIRYGEDGLVARMREVAEAEDKSGDGRALRVIERILAAVGYGREK
jgi:hypothetical protein